MSNKQLLEAWVRDYSRFISSQIVEFVHYDEVEEITQDAYLYVLERLDTFDSERGVEFTTWAGRVLRNFLINMVRPENAPEVELVSEWEFSDEETDGSWIEESYTGESDATADPLELLVAQEAAEALERRSDVLTGGEQRVWELRAIDGLTFAEVGARLGIKPQSAQNLFQSAKAKMLL